MENRPDPQPTPEEQPTSPRRADQQRVRRLLLKAGMYAAPAILATALTAENAAAYIF